MTLAAAGVVALSFAIKRLMGYLQSFITKDIILSYALPAQILLLTVHGIIRHIGAYPAFDLRVLFSRHKIDDDELPEKASRNVFSVITLIVMCLCTYFYEFNFIIVIFFVSCLDVMYFFSEGRGAKTTKIIAIMRVRMIRMVPFTLNVLLVCRIFLGRSIPYHPYIPERYSTHWLRYAVFALILFEKCTAMFAYIMPISEAFAALVLEILHFLIADVLFTHEGGYSAYVAPCGLVYVTTASIIALIVREASIARTGKAPKEHCPMDTGTSVACIIIPSLWALLHYSCRHLSHEAFNSAVDQNMVYVWVAALFLINIYCSNAHLTEVLDDYVVRSAIAADEIYHPYEAKKYAAMYWEEYKPYRPGNETPCDRKNIWYTRLVIFCVYATAGSHMYIPDLVHVGGCAVSPFSVMHFCVCMYSLVDSKYEQYLNYFLWAFRHVYYVAAFVFNPPTEETTPQSVIVSTVLEILFDPMMTYFHNYSFTQGVVNRCIFVYLLYVRFREIVDRNSAQGVTDYAPESEMILHFKHGISSLLCCSIFTNFVFFQLKHKHAYIRARHSLCTKRTIKMLAESSKRQIANSFRLSFPSFNVLEWRTLERINVGLSKLSSAQAAILRCKEADFVTLNFIHILRRSVNSSVYCAKMKKGILVAVRSPTSLGLLTQDDMNCMIGRLAAYASILHPNIVTMHGHCWSPMPCIIYEHFGDDTVARIVTRIRDERNTKVPEYDRWMRFTVKVFIDISRAIAYLHSRRIYYGPLCPEYIRVGDNYWRGDQEFKLADLPFIWTKKHWDKQHGGIPFEVLRSEATPDDVSLDIYALGICMWKMAMIEPDEPRHLDVKLVLGTMKRYIPDSVRRCIAHCISPDASRRPKATAISKTLRDAEEELLMDRGAYFKPDQRGYTVGSRLSSTKKHVKWS